MTINKEAYMFLKGLYSGEHEYEPEAVIDKSFTRKKQRELVKFENEFKEKYSDPEIQAEFIEILDSYERAESEQARIAFFHGMRHGARLIAVLLNIGV